MHLKRIEVEGYRASANTPIGCELRRRGSLILGTNGSGKKMINAAITLAHPRSFPPLTPIDATALGATPRAVRVEYEFEADASRVGALGQYRKRQGLAAPRWDVYSSGHSTARRAAARITQSSLMVMQTVLMIITIRQK